MLTNKQTGHPGKISIDPAVHPEPTILVYDTVDEQDYFYKTLAGVLDEWTEENEHYYIDCDGEILCAEELTPETIEKLNKFGNFFPNKDSARYARDRLAALRRLELRGMRFTGGSYMLGKGQAEFMYPGYGGDVESFEHDIDLFFDIDGDNH